MTEKKRADALTELASVMTPVLEKYNIAGALIAIMPGDEMAIGLSTSAPGVIHGECEDGHAPMHYEGNDARLFFLKLVRDAVEAKITKLEQP